jgi:hypothetical protein
LDRERLTMSEYEDFDAAVTGVVKTVREERRSKGIKTAAELRTIVTDLLVRNPEDPRVTAILALIKGNSDEDTGEALKALGISNTPVSPGTLALASNPGGAFQVYSPDGKPMGVTATAAQSQQIGAQPHNDLNGQQDGWWVPNHPQALVQAFAAPLATSKEDPSRMVRIYAKKGGDTGETVTFADGNADGTLEYHRSNDGSTEFFQKKAKWL